MLSCSLETFQRTTHPINLEIFCKEKSPWRGGFTPRFTSVVTCRAVLRVGGSLENHRSSGATVRHLHQRHPGIATEDGPGLFLQCSEHWDGFGGDRRRASCFRCCFSACLLLGHVSSERPKKTRLIDPLPARTCALYCVLLFSSKKKKKTRRPFGCRGFRTVGTMGCWAGCNKGRASEDIRHGRPRVRRF